MDLFAEAKERLAAAGTLLLVPELAELVAKEPVRGSWWSHPKGKAIFAVASRLEDSPDVVTAKLVEGKVTFVHARLWPALLRIVTDRAWRLPRVAALAPDAKALLTRVERGKRLVVEGKDLAKARKALETSILVRSLQEHSATGKHVPVLESWKGWASPDVAAAAARLSLAEARATLRECRVEL